MEGRLSCPVPLTSSSATISSPLVVFRRQTLSTASQRAPAISVLKRMCRARSYLRAQLSMYSRISDCGAHFRDQSVFCSNEKQYENDGTSHAAPGYVFSRQVPPS